MTDNPTVLENLIGDTVPFGHANAQHIQGRHPNPSFNHGTNEFTNTTYGPDLGLNNADDVSNYLKNDFFDHPKTVSYISSDNVLMAYNSEHNVMLAFDTKNVDGGTVFRPNDFGTKFHKQHDFEKKHPSSSRIAKGQEGSDLTLNEYSKRVSKSPTMQNKLNDIIDQNNLDNPNAEFRPYQSLSKANLTTDYNAAKVLSGMSDEQKLLASNVMTDNESYAISHTTPDGNDVSIFYNYDDASIVNIENGVPTLQSFYSADDAFEACDEMLGQSGLTLDDMKVGGLDALSDGIEAAGKTSKMLDTLSDISSKLLKGAKIVGKILPAVGLGIVLAESAEAAANLKEAYSNDEVSSEFTMEMAGALTAYAAASEDPTVLAGELMADKLEQEIVEREAERQGLSYDEMKDKLVGLGINIETINEAIPEDFSTVMGIEGSDPHSFEPQETTLNLGSTEDLIEELNNTIESSTAAAHAPVASTNEDISSIVENAPNLGADFADAAGEGYEPPAPDIVVAPDNELGIQAPTGLLGNITEETPVTYEDVAAVEADIRPEPIEAIKPIAPEALSELHANLPDKYNPDDLSVSPEAQSLIEVKSNPEMFEQQARELHENGGLNIHVMPFLEKIGDGIKDVFTKDTPDSDVSRVKPQGLDSGGLSNGSSSPSIPNIQVKPLSPN